MDLTSVIPQSDPLADNASLPTPMGSAITLRYFARLEDTEAFADEFRELAGREILRHLGAWQRRRWGSNLRNPLFCPQWPTRRQSLDYPNAQAVLRGSRMDESTPLAGYSGERPRTELQKRVDNGESPRSILEELYRRLQGRLFARVRKSMRNAADAEDVVANVFLKMQQHFDAMITREPVDGWIFKVAYNEIANFYRAQPKELVVDPEIAGQDWFERIEDETAPPHEVAEQIDTGERTLAHLVVLTERGSISRTDLADYWAQVVMGVAQKDLARKRGVGQPRISQRKTAVSKELCISFYLCYVLGTVRPPYRAAAIREHLDIFDLDPGPLKDADRKLLRRAGSAVSAGPDGEIELRCEDAKAAIQDPRTGPVASLEELHDAESVYAVAIGNPAPRCIARPCSRHKASGATGGEAR
jgi:DNA-directed RNA polymerase specialized sigma24 family protein